MNKSDLIGLYAAAFSVSIINLLFSKLVFRARTGTFKNSLNRTPRYCMGEVYTGFCHYTSDRFKGMVDRLKTIAEFALLKRITGGYISARGHPV